MTPVLPTRLERITALRSFGYAEREAAFLLTAALHGGYFLRRQYCSAIGTQSGDLDTLTGRSAVDGNEEGPSTCDVALGLGLRRWKQSDCGKQQSCNDRK